MQHALSSLDTWQQKGEWLTCSKGKLFVRSQGRGPALLLIHGFPTSSWDWHAVFDELAKHFQVLAIDMLGYGYSDKPKNVDYTTPLQAQLLLEILRQKSIKSTHIMTYSYGVSVAQEILRQQQAGDFDIRIDSLCCMNGGLFPNSNHPRLAQKLLLGKLGWLFVKLLNKNSLKKNMKSIFGPDTQPSQALIDQYWHLVNVNQGRSIMPRLIQYLHERKDYMHQWEDALRKANCPVQLIIGDQDDISGVEVAKEYRAKISDKHVHIIENIGHYPQIEAPEKVCELYLDFTRSIDMSIN